MPHLTPGDYVQLSMLLGAPVVLVILWMRDVIRPGSFSRGGLGRDPSRVAAPVWLVCALAVLLSPMIGENLIRAMPSGVVGGAGSIRHDGLAAAMTYLGSCAVGAFLVYLLLPRAGDGAGLRARWSDIPVGLGAFLLAAPIVQSASIASVYFWAIITHEKPEDIAHSTLREIVANQSNPWVWPLIACAAVGAPIVEELIFRVFLTSAIRRRPALVWPAILISAALFALMHRLHGPGDEPVPWYAVAPLFVLGVSFGVAYERTGRLLVPMVMHGAYNGANILIAMTLL